VLVVVLEEPVYQLFQLGDLSGGSFFGLALALQLACGSEDLDGLYRRLAGACSAVALRPLPRHPRPPPSFVYRPLPYLRAWRAGAGVSRVLRPR
jgi:hypothetical protein